MSSGILISFEGADGVGKSTQIKLLAQALKIKKYKVLVTREPGGTPVGDKLRKILLSEKMTPKTELLIFEAIRAEHVETKLKPAIQKKIIILSDRYEESSLVYQGLVRGIPLDEVRAANQLATTGLRSKLVILLDSSDRTSIQRLNKRYAGRQNLKDRFERERDSFHLKVQRGFRSLAKRDKRFKVYDSNLDRQLIHRMILKDVEKLIQKM